MVGFFMTELRQPDGLTDYLVTEPSCKYVLLE